jgi:hypothetical protein
MLGGWCRGGRSFVVIAGATVGSPIAATKVRARPAVIVKTTTTMMASAVGRMAVKRGRHRHVGCRRWVGRIGSSERARRWIAKRGTGIRSAHWSGGYRLRVGVVESDPDRRSHELTLWRSTIVVAATAAASSASIRSLVALRLRMSGPLLSWGSRLRSRARISLIVRGLGRVLRRAGVRRLLLIDLGSIVGMVVLSGQRSVRSALRRVLLCMLGVPLLLGWLLWVARLRRRRRSGIRWRALMGVVLGRLVVAVARMVRLMRLVRLVVATAFGTSAASATVAAARGSIGRVTAWGTARGRYRWSRRGRTVIVRHGA